jgi:TPR repeat protein
MYIQGKGTPKNNEQALKWYTKAGEQGLVEAQFILGVIYNLGV